jgi:hypothetical protein
MSEISSEIKVNLVYKQKSIIMSDAAETGR